MLLFLTSSDKQVFNYCEGQILINSNAVWKSFFFWVNQYWNEEHETNYNSTVEGEPANRLKEDAYGVRGLYEDKAQRTSIGFPSHLENFDDCAINSVMW